MKTKHCVERKWQSSLFLKTVIRKEFGKQFVFVFWRIIKKYCALLYIVIKLMHIT